MDTLKNNQDYNNTTTNQDNDDENRPLPGFRFHPTDEELVGFYLRAKVDEKPMKIDHLIRETDIYKHNPWDLPKTRDGGDNHNSEEMYFFCKRGKKYKNSERPNRVTGSGFWKATGIDKPIYTSRGGESLDEHHRDIIGLKKTLVYYRGSAGKGTKTEWMMHELRLPNANSDSDKPATQEAEVWTVCRIFRRVNISNKTYTGDCGDLQSKQLTSPKHKNCTTAVDLGFDDSTIESYISFATDQTMVHYNDDDKMSELLDHHAISKLRNEVHINEGLGLMLNDSSSVLIHQPPSATASATSSSNFNITADDDLQMDQQFVSNYETWDELRYVVHQFDSDSSHHL